MTARISAAKIQPEHGKTVGLQGEAKTPQALTPTGAAETVQQQHQRARRCAWQVGAGMRPIQKRQQRASGGSTTRQSRNRIANGFATVRWKRNRAERVAQGLQVATDPGKTLLMREPPAAATAGGCR